MTDDPGKDLAPRPAAPPPIDPEQLRQFEEFQRFQEFQRYQREHGGATPPPPPPPPAPPRKPVWQILLASKLVRRLVYLLVLLLIGWIAYLYYFGGDDPNDVPFDSGGSTGGAQGMPQPWGGTQGLVGKMYQFVADGDTTYGCAYFHTDQVKAKFAQAWGASDCAGAVQAAKKQITDLTAYQLQPQFPPHMSGTPTTSKVTVDSCELDVKGGPRLGTFVVEKIDRGWVITDYSASGTC